MILERIVNKLGKMDINYVAIQVKCNKQWRQKNKMKKQGTKIIGGLMVAMIIATIGAVLVSAETEDAEDTEEWHMPFIGRGMFSQDLTDEQQAELEELITSLSEEGATIDEINEAVNQLLDEWGILDERLDNKIEQTQEQLAILERADELRDQGYSWDEINDIIQGEFDIDYHISFGQDMMFGHGHGHHHHPGGFFESEESLDMDTESDTETTSV